MEDLLSTGPTPSSFYMTVGRKVVPFSRYVLVCSGQAVPHEDCVPRPGPGSLPVQCDSVTG